MTELTELTASIQQGIRHRQEELLELETVIDRVRRRRQGPRVILDRAEDVRRAVRVQHSDQAVPVMLAVRAAEEHIASAAADETLPGAEARTALHAANAMHGRVRRLQMDLDDVARALKPLASAAATDPNLLLLADEVVDSAISSLSRASGEAWRISQDLLILERAADRAIRPREATGPEPAPVSVRVPPEERAVAPPVPGSHQTMSR